MTNKILTNVSRETISKKEDIEIMFYELFNNHYTEEDGIDLEIIQIVALKMFLRETCKQNGLLTKAPFSLKPNDGYASFGQYIADEINYKVNRINQLERTERLAKELYRQPSTK
tara:strand:- start:51 stop:392 length:342 start_codon:yes stop_codon:yes gene_type:complete